MSKDPEYTQVLYYILELTGVAAAALLLTRYPRLGWVLSLGVAAGPILGYVLSRGPGLPDYTDEIGNWTEPIGVLSLIVEGTCSSLRQRSWRVLANAISPDRQVAYPHIPHGRSNPRSCANC
ncbi:MAG TPA: hypothetical protein VFA63_04970 [Pseudonocardiaceae bacterium]|nr:hypothetical protein [Pseudonocardiaceae bacterium]